jgi:hypothetical protein
MAEFGRLRPHPEERCDYEKKEDEIRGSKHPRREIVKEQLAKPMSDKPVLAHGFGATVCPKNILPNRQWTRNAQDTLKRDNADQEQVDGSEPEITHKTPPSEVTAPNDREGRDNKQHNDCMHDQYGVGQAH